MHTLWDRWKHEMQEEHSFSHRLIEEMVEGVVRDLVDRLPNEEGALLTLATDALDELDDEPHRREVQDILDEEIRDRFERDNEPYR